MRAIVLAGLLLSGSIGGGAPAAVARAPVALSSVAATATGNVGATVPEVSAPSSDGMPTVVAVARHRLRVPVWAAPATPSAIARLTANGRVLAQVTTVPGAVVWLSGEVDVRPGELHVVLDVAGRRLRVFTHRTSG